MIRQESRQLKINPVAMKGKLRSLKVKYRVLKFRIEQSFEMAKENNPNSSHEASDSNIELKEKENKALQKDCSICLGAFEEH